MMKGELQGFVRSFISDIISSLVKLFLFSRVKIKNTVSYIKLTKLKTVLIGTVFNFKKKTSKAGT